MPDVEDEFRKRQLNRVGYGVGGGLVVGCAIWTLGGSWWWVVVFLAVGVALGLFLRTTTPPGPQD
ncbi:hypothetical protein Ae168Ps1_5084c [Pseudonocardia sp. Ae168_Ps1]|nr:hypothetical protein FRP1_18620 [Pseudonocardia sp. EC080625-04]ALL77908.1 hypothetical protein AD006_26070 [Pseudonocardia sp. EC080610-09]OLL76667.1 hypothetical protein Ae150APs1_5045c [Pseudonocardia sp. Ae150A_Ps1]OLL82678.1 hypothetical protein Ae168Ps1_5084c [Pseudonocardia sp. Ae168_Ps1]OLL83209.1 hypothetical protein Ae263Ps1_0264 [Pseudonocardia sp. Ae263_Ps1]OLL90753.1 hypothetical protein Ae356Ps1_0650c [Pseudonocardia sp. Ae356_Ps1]